jgi:hypothetical protein
VSDVNTTVPDITPLCPTRILEKNFALGDGGNLYFKKKYTTLHAAATMSKSNSVDRNDIFFLGWADLQQFLHDDF